MGMLAGLVFMSHQLGSAIGIYPAGKLYDLSGRYTAIYLMGILLLLGASLVSYVI
jgi:MFS family permease